MLQTVEKNIYLKAQNSFPLLIVFRFFFNYQKLTKISQSRNMLQKNHIMQKIK
jgi:hypothetical protein